MTNNKILDPCPTESMTKAEQRVLDILARLNRDADSALGRGRHDDYRAAVNRMIDVQDAFYDSFGRQHCAACEGARRVEVNPAGMWEDGTGHYAPCAFCQGTGIQYSAAETTTATFWGIRARHFSEEA